MKTLRFVNKRAICLPVYALFVVFCPDALAAEFGGYAALTSDCVGRGVTQSNEDHALQLGAEVGFESGFYMGAWASTAHGTLVRYVNIGAPHTASGRYGL